MAITEREDPITLFNEWYREAAATNIEEPNAMSLATADAQGHPSIRIVLLKDVSEEGFVFYTNLESRKSLEIKENPYASLCFWWPSLERQVRVEGPVLPVDDQVADAYFASRPRESRIGAYASRQSRPLENRFALEKRVALYTARFALGNIPRPDFWSGWRVVPERIEFWMKRPFRLHDRLLYTRSPTGWTTDRLYP